MSEAAGAMSRRRLTLQAYVRRRWRVLGAILVLLLGSLLVLAVTDRGHDPIWEANAPELAQAALAPDASAAYALLRDNGTLDRLVAHRGDDGALLWEGQQLDTRGAVLAADATGVAVASDFPLAFLTVYGVDGSIQWQLPLEGSPIAMDMEGAKLALALDAPSLGNPVLLFDGAGLLHTFHHADAVRALSLEADVVAVGTAQGVVVVRRMDGTEVVNTSLAMSPTSLRLSQDGTSLVVGGRGSTPTGTGGRIAFFDLGANETLRWEQDTLVDVGLVDIDASGLVALAIEESPPSATIHVYEGATGATRWTRLVGGSVVSDDAGVFGRASLSPDARRIAVATADDDVRVFDALDGSELWAFRAGGASLVAFAEEDPTRILVGGRLLANRPYDTLLLFSASAEPLAQRAALLGVALSAAATLAASTFVGVGFWRARHRY